jgi:uridine kinase
MLPDVRKEDLLEQLAGAITTLEPPHPVRVAIAGLCASGKTSLADELAPVIERRGRACVRSSLDDFHPLGHAPRSAAGGYTGETYYTESYEYRAFRDHVLAPLGPGGDRRCRLALNDSYHDCAYPEEWTDVPSDAVVIVDGGFLFHPTLIDHWDYKVWLQVDRETSVARARRRDTAWAGSAELVEERYRLRNLPAHDRHIAASRAPDIADAVIDNDDIDSPTFVRI